MLEYGVASVAVDEYAKAFDRQHVCPRVTVDIGHDRVQAKLLERQQMAGQQPAIPSIAEGLECSLEWAYDHQVLIAVAVHVAGGHVGGLFTGAVDHRMARPGTRRAVEHEHVGIQARAGGDQLAWCGAVQFDRQEVPEALPVGLRVEGGWPHKPAAVVLQPIREPRAGDRNVEPTVAIEVHQHGRAIHTIEREPAPGLEGSVAQVEHDAHAIPHRDRQIDVSVAVEVARGDRIRRRAHAVVSLGRAESQSALVADHAHPKRIRRDRHVEIAVVVQIGNGDVIRRRRQVHEYRIGESPARQALEHRDLVHESLGSQRDDQIRAPVVVQIAGKGARGMFIRDRDNQRRQE